MHRESVYLCTYGSGEQERIGHVRAWDDGEAAELFARELEVEFEGTGVRPADVRVRRVLAGEGAVAAPR
jgi:hypothetical protein